MYDTDQETELPEPRPLDELCHAPVWRCAVHGSEPGEGFSYPPGEDELVHELVGHLTGDHTGIDWCTYCHDEYEIRSQGIEDVNLYEQHCLREVEASCDCRHSPRLVRAVARWQVDGICPVCDGDEGRHLSTCPFLVHLATRPRPSELV